MIHEYDNTEIFYKKQSDPRELNVVSRIKCEAEMKAQLPKMNEEPVCFSTLQQILSNPADIIVKGDNGKDYKLVVTEEGEIATAELVKMSIRLVTKGLALEETEEGFRMYASNPMTLKFAKADPSVGRGADGWWFHFYVDAPESMKTEEDFADAVYINKVGGAEKRFWSVKDSKADAERHFLSCWAGITQKKLDKAIAAGEDIQWYYRFQWNKASTQVLRISIDPSVLNLLP